jgi:hypothetical protein
MIRPLTFVALLLAGTSGLYLYQTKHRAEVLDGQITHTLRQVSAARERIGILRAEWALLNEPDRLGQLAAQHLDLQPLQPPRFVAAADLASRIPMPTPPETLAGMPVADGTPASPPGDSVQVVDTTPIQAAIPAVAAPPRPTLVAATHVSSPPQPHPAPSRIAARASVAQHQTGHATYSLASSAAPEPVATPSARQPVFAPVLRAMATPMAAPSPGAAQVGLVTARSSIPVVTSALGGFGRSSLAPPIPVEGR